MDEATRGPPYGKDDTYPFVVGGLVHDALNTLWPLLYRIAQVRSRELEQGHPAPFSKTGEDVRLVPCLAHLDKLLRLIQYLSQEYYKKPTTSESSHTEKLSAIVDACRARHPEIRYEASLDPAFDQCGLPLGVTTFVLGELLENASRACEGQADATITVTALRKGPEFLFACRDNGPGIEDELRALITAGALEPPSETGEGGYGLFLTQEIVRRLSRRRGAFILIRNVAPHGANVEIHFGDERGTSP